MNDMLAMFMLFLFSLAIGGLCGFTVARSHYKNVYCIKNNYDPDFAYNLGYMEFLGTSTDYLLAKDFIDSPGYWVTNPFMDEETGDVSFRIMKKQSAFSSRVWRSVYKDEWIVHYKVAGKKHIEVLSKEEFQRRFLRLPSVGDKKKGGKK